MSKNEEDITYFIAFCVELYKNAHNLSGEQAMLTLEKFGVLDYLSENFEVLHTQSHKWIVEDINEFIRIRKEQS